MFSFEETDLTKLVGRLKWLWFS